MAGSDVRIAVADGEKFFRDAICETLGSAGFSCVIAEDGTRALELAADDSVGVVVLDLRLPEAGGLSVLRELRRSRPELRVLVLSASTDQETVLEALRLGACDYLAKPLHDEELLLAVSRAAEDHQLAAASHRLQLQLSRLASLSDDLSRRAAATDGEDRNAFLRQAAALGAAELLGAEKTSLMLPDDAGDELHVVAAVTPGIAVDEMDPVPAGQGVAGVVYERAEGLLRESQQAEHPVPSAQVEGRYPSDSFVVAPVKSGGRSLGVLCATEPLRAAGFGLEDLALLELFAGRLGPLLTANDDAKEEPVAEVRPEREVRARAEDEDPALDSELMRQICEALVNDVEPDRVIGAVLRPIERELRAAPVSIHLLDAEREWLHCEGQLDGGSRVDRAKLPTSRGLTGTVLQTGRLVATAAPEVDPRYDAEVDTPEDGQPGPLLCVPLSLRGRAVGLCRVFLPAGAPASARTAEALAAALSAAVRNVLLYRSLVESIEEVAEARRQARP